VGLKVPLAAVQILVLGKVIEIFEDWFMGFSTV
jgi:hypothetical protein